MVFLVITRQGYESYRSLGNGASGVLWVAAGVITNEEISALRQDGVNVSDFNYAMELHESDVIAGTVETIKEHHPGEPVFVEA